MLRSTGNMKSYALGARDGRIGHVEEFYFDDKDWTLRYLVARAGNWLTGRMVLLSPHVLGKPDDIGKQVPVDLTREQVRQSPSPETDRPVSRQFEMEYYRYFGWPYYWTGPYLWGTSPFPLSTPVPFEGAPDAAAPDSQAPKGDPHLRSTAETTGYHIHAQDGEIGHVEDFLYDDRDWAIRYLVVDTRNWRPGRTVLIPPAWIGEIRWLDRMVDADVTRDEILRAPAYDPALPITSESERILERYYASRLHNA